MAALIHLTKRFFGAVRPGAPAKADEAWARDQLLAGEQAIWGRMNNPDRRHAVGVARAVAVGLETVDRDRSNDRAVMAAALLHDSGKVISGFRTPARVVATVIWAALGDDTAETWLETSEGGARHRLAQYRRHPELGAEMLEAAGSDPLTWNWAAQHHQPEQHWTVPVEIGRVLKACDDD